MNRFWVKSYPPGIPAEVDLAEFRSINHISEISYGKYPDLVAYVQMGREMTYRELDAATRSFAAWNGNKRCIRQAWRGLAMNYALRNKLLQCQFECHLQSG